jgi:thioesterase domain-containing protein
MPRLDANADAAVIGRWLAAPGDAIPAGQPIAEIATDKATYELEAENEGILRWQAPADGTALPVGYVIALLAGDADEPLPEVTGENEALMEAFRNSPLGPGFAEEYPPATVEPTKGGPPKPDAGPEAECLVTLQSEGRGTPLFFITPARAGHLRSLARHMGRERPFYAVQPFGVVDRANPRIEIVELARRYVAAICRAQPEGPYLLAGVSSGGVVALEAAHQLLREGRDVGPLMVVDALARPTLFRPFGGLLGVLRRQPAQLRQLWKAPARARVAAARSLASAVRMALPLGRAPGAAAGAGAAGRGGSGRQAVVRMVDAHRRAASRYQMEPFPGRIVYFWSTGSWFLSPRDPRIGWRRLALGGFDLRRVPGYHHEVLEEPHVQVLASELRSILPA